MAKYIMDVSFDIPKEILAEIPAEDTMSKISSNMALTRFDKSDKPEEECSSARISLEGSDSWCQKQALRLRVSVDTPQGVKRFKATSYEIVHCQG